MIKSMIGNGTGSVIDSIIGVPVPNDFVAKYTAYYTQEFNLVTGNKVADQYDQTTQYYGPELFINPPDVVNGFTDNGDGSYTVSSATGSQDQLIMSNVTEDLKSYHCTITIDSISAGQINFAVDGDGSPVYTSVGTYTSIVTRNGGGDNLNVYGSTDFVGTVSNISVKEVLTGANDLTQSTSGNQPTLVEQNVITQFTSANQPTFVEGFSGTGDELVTNGTFDTDSDWTKGAGWTISGGSASSTGSNSGQALEQPLAGLVVGSTYQITGTFTNYTSGELTFRLGGTNIITNITPSNGTFSYIGQMDAVGSPSSIRVISTANNFIGSIDNISVKEAVKDTTKDKVSFDTNDFMEGLPPQNEPILGAELVTNGTLDTDSDWSYDASYMTIASGKCTWNGLASSNLSQSSVVEIGKQYVVTFDVSDMTTGLLLFRNPASTTELTVSTNGSYSHVYTAQDTFVTFRGSSGFDGSIDNISVKEITGYQDFTYVFKGVEIADNLEQRLLSDGAGSNFKLITTNNTIRASISGTDIFLGTFTVTSFNTVIFKREGTTISAYIDGVLAGTPVTNSGEFVGSRLMQNGAGLDGSLQSLEVYDVAVSDVNNITEAPVYTLKSDLVDIPSGYGQMPKWYSKQHSIYNNKVSFDTDDFMEGLPVQSGDFTYVFKGVEIADNLEQRLLSDGVSSNFRLNSFSNLIQINAGGIYRDLGTFTGTSFNTVIFKREGTTISAYIDGVLAGTPQTNAGNFVGSRLMHNSVGLDGSLQSLYVYGRALSLYEIELHSRN